METSQRLLAPFASRGGHGHGARILTVTWTVVTALFVQSASLPYRMEPLARHGCVWSSNNRNATAVGTVGHGDMALNCHVRTLGAEFWNYTFSPEQRRSTVGLTVKCNDKLYFESSLKANTSFSSLVHLRTVAFDSCKIRKVPSKILSAFSDLRALRISTRNSDWSPSIGLELEEGCFQGLKSLESLDLSSSNVWNLPESLLCPHLPNLLKLNLSSNRLIELPEEFSAGNPGSAGSVIAGSAGIAGSGSAPLSACTLKLSTLDVSQNAIRRIGPRALSSLPGLVQFRLQRNLIEELSDSSFSGLSSLRSLNLSSNRLVALPPFVFKSSPILRELFLQNNSLTALSPGIFSSLSALVILDLSRNALSSVVVKDTLFQALGQVLLIRLSHNQLSVIDSRLFKGLPSLEALYLDSNRIEVIDPEAFQALSNLRVLDLSRNRLSSVDSRLLGNCFLLQSLFLDHNQLSALGPSTLDNCTQLTDVGLSGNHLTRVPAALRSGLRLLRSLDLGENRIMEVSNESFAGLEEIYGLRLVDNRIEALPSGFCASLIRLRVLNLAQNRISTVAGTAFIGCRDLSALRLDTNQLSEVPRLGHLPGLLWLNISGNRIRRADFEGLPRALEWLDLSYNALEALGWRSETEKSLPASHLRVLDVSFNRLAKVDSNTIPPALETLRINHNRLSALAPGTFSAATNLRRIELVGNLLEVVPLEALAFPAIPASKALPELFLSGNPLHCDCSMDWLSPTNQLQLLASRRYPRLADSDSLQCKLSPVRNLENQNSENQNLENLVPISKLESSHFLCNYTQHCPSQCHCCDFEACDCQRSCPDACTCHHDTEWALNVVTCSSANFEAIPARIPMDATEIRLDGNAFLALGNHHFIGKTKARALYLNDSRIEALKNKTFNGLRALEVLHLENNLLSVLHGWEFSDLVALRELHLSNNLLERIEPATFRVLTLLEVLTLQGNLLVYFDAWALTSNGHLRALSLSQNPWSCECDFVTQLLHWTDSKGSLATDIQLTQCQSPESETLVQVPLTSVCGGGESESGAEVGHEPPLEKQAVTHPEPGSVPTEVAMDWDSTMLLVGVLCTVVAVAFFGGVLWIFRKELFSLWKNRLGVGGKGGRNRGGGDSGENKLFDAYFLYSAEEEEVLREKLIPELEANSAGKGGNRCYRLCLQSDLCHGLENPWNLEMVTSAGEASQRIVILLSTALVRGALNGHFRRALGALLSTHPRKVVLVLLPPLSSANISSLVNILPELSVNQAIPGAGNPTFIEWADPHFREKLRRLLPHPSGGSDTVSTVQNLLTHQHPPRPHQRVLKQPSLWPHHTHNHFHSTPVHSIATAAVGHHAVAPGYCDPLLAPAHPPPPFRGSHGHEHQNSVSTISNTYPPLTEQNLSDSSNTLGSIGWEEHVYSTLDTPLSTRSQSSPRESSLDRVNAVKGHGGPEVNGPCHGSPSGHMYFV